MPCIMAVRITGSDKKYYLADLHNTLSRNVKDAVIFEDTATAETYTLKIEDYIKGMNEKLSAECRLLPIEDSNIPAIFFDVIT